MKFIIPVLLILGLAFAVGPVDAWEADKAGVLYSSPVELFETANEVSGNAAIYTVFNAAADTLPLWYDLDSDDYTSCDMRWRFSLIVDGTDVLTKAKVYLNPAAVCSTRAAGDTLSVQNMNSGGDILGSPLYYTVIPSAASYAAKYLWGVVTPGQPWLSPWYTYDATVSSDSAGFAPIVITTDSLELQVELFVILRE